MSAIKILFQGHLAETVVSGGCGECKNSCQSACKTSCTVGNQVCRQESNNLRQQPTRGRE